MYLLTYIYLVLCIYICIYIYACFIEKEFSYNENGKFQYILSIL